MNSRVSWSLQCGAVLLVIVLGASSCRCGGASSSDKPSTPTLNAPDDSGRAAQAAEAPSEAPHLDGARGRRILHSGSFTLNDVLELVEHFVPAVDGGKVLGLRVYGAKPGSALARLGLMNGDIIRGMNRLELTTPESVMALPPDANTPLVSVEIIREGIEVTIAYEVH